MDKENSRTKRDNNNLVPQTVRIIDVCFRIIGGVVTLTNVWVLILIREAEHGSLVKQTFDFFNCHYGALLMIIIGVCALIYVAFGRYATSLLLLFATLSVFTARSVIF